MKYTEKILKRISLSGIFIFMMSLYSQAQERELLTLDKIYSGYFQPQHFAPIQWVEKGKAYVVKESSKEGNELIRYEIKTGKKTPFIPAKKLQLQGKPLAITSFTLSKDGSKVLIFTNAKRVWRSNTRGDYWVYDFNTQKLTQLGAKFPPSTLMFAKFSKGNDRVAYVQNFNLYIENFKDGKITQLTSDGNGKIINGTFDWVYEEEFGKRDGFLWSPDAQLISFWQLDASNIGTFYMINNTDSIYPKLIPLQYPKVGEAPSAAKLGIIHTQTLEKHWISLPGDPYQHYIPGMQWVNEDLLLIQQMNRKQNQLLVWSYQPSSKKLSQVYDEEMPDASWIDLGYPDISYNSWGNNDLKLVDDGASFLRMTEVGDWRQVYKINITTRLQTTLTPETFDVASVCMATEDKLYFIASPQNSTQRYLYQVGLKGAKVGKEVQNIKRVTPQMFAGVNTYDIAPNGAYAIHRHQSSEQVPTVRLISLPEHKTLKNLIENKTYADKLSKLFLPKVEFTHVKVYGGLDMDVRMIYPYNFNKEEKYPVLFHVYGEPWAQVATDTQIGLWNIMMSQKGFIIVDIDNRGTPCLKGSLWRKCIYGNLGMINVSDQAEAARELLRTHPYLDQNRTAVWGWSGGGSMTMNLMFRYPEIYKTGVAVAGVSNQLIYDNIYQERYMGLPQENKQRFIDGSPVTYAKNLEGNLMIIHGTADDNVHYQSAEMLINELIKHNKKFDMMAYPNRSHGIYEGKNTRRHLYTLITDYIIEHTKQTK